MEGDVAINARAAMIKDVSMVFAHILVLNLI